MVAKPLQSMRHISPILLVFLLLPLAMVVPQPQTYWSVDIAPFFAADLKRSSPLIQGDTTLSIYKTTSVCAFDIETGAPIWLNTLNGVATADMITGDQYLYAVSGQRAVCRLYAFNFQTGAQVFSVELPVEPARTSLIFFNGSILVPLKNGELVAYDGNNGEEEWALELGGESSTWVEGEGILFLAVGKRLVALDPYQGEISWENDYDNEVGALGIAGDLLLVGVGRELFLLGLNGEEETRIELKGGEVLKGRIGLSEGKAYVATRTLLNEVDLTSRQLTSYKKVTTTARAQPLIYHRAIIFVTEDEGVLIYDPKLRATVVAYQDFSPVFEARLDDHKNLLVFLDTRGLLVVLKLPIILFSFVEEPTCENLRLGLKGDIISLSTAPIFPELELRTPDEALIYSKDIRDLTLAAPTCGFTEEIALLEPYTELVLQIKSAVGEVLYSTTFSPPCVPLEPIAWADISLKGPDVAVVGEEFGLNVSVEVNASGTLDLLLTGEGAQSQTEYLGFVERGSRLSLLLNIVPLTEGELSLEVKALLNGSVVGTRKVDLTCETGFVLEGIEPPRLELEVGERGEMSVRLKNRVSDNATFEISLWSDISSSNSSIVGPFRAGEETEVVLTIEGTRDGTSTLSIEAKRDEDVLEEREIELVVFAPPPPPPAGPQTISKLISPISSFFAPRVGETAANALALGLISVVPISILAALIRGLRRRGMTVIPEEVVPPEAGEELIEVGEELFKEEEAVERLKDLAGGLGSTRKRIEGLEISARRMEEERFLGLSERLDAVKDLVDEAEKLADEKKFDEGESRLKRANDGLDSVEDFTRSLEDLLSNWIKVEGRIRMMISLWGRASASLLTMMPQELRIMALDRYARLHPEMGLELRGDELFVKGKE